MLFVNSSASRAPYPTELRDIMSVEKARESRTWLSNWLLLNAGTTPLWPLPNLAGTLGVAQLWVKDESLRSPLASFKALGAPIALIRLIMRLMPEKGFDPKGLIDGQYKEQLRDFTVISAANGNHGLALAAAALSVGCGCVIVLHANVSLERETAIAAYGARIVRVDGNYNESVAHTAQLAEDTGWLVVSDISHDGYEDVPRDVMQVYGTIVDELIEQTCDHTEASSPFTHIFVQGGVGGLAAGISSYLWEYYQEDRPILVVVEPHQADCLFQSAVQGHAAKATEIVDSVMAGLACGETSPLAWRFLQPGIEFFMTISDENAVIAMRLLAKGGHQDVPLVAGESGSAGLAGLLELQENPALAHQVGITADSRVLIINTEGATAPEVYGSLVKESAQSVIERQRVWLKLRLLVETIQQSTRHHK